MVGLSALSLTPEIRASLGEQIFYIFFRVLCSKYRWHLLQSSLPKGKRDREIIHRKQENNTSWPLT